jgi:peptidyl-prolyl cis-trans isomerase A (cyclophilin A)
LRSVSGLCATAALAACVFTPPPPLPEEVEAEQARIARAKASAPAQIAATQGGGASTDAETLAAQFKQGDEPLVGMSPAEIHAYNAAQGDPVAGDFPLDQALAGVEGDGTLFAEVVTGRGVMSCELFVDRTPITIANFAALARGLRPVLDKDSESWAAEPYYDGSTFHRVIPGFMIQGGDPSGTGFGNPGYVVQDEVFPDLRHDEPGMLSMANKGASTGSAQFFITLGPAPHLDGKHTVFGKCDDASLKVADDISLTPRGPDDRPLEPEVIETIRIVRK